MDIGSLEVVHDEDLQSGLVVQLAHDDRDLLQAGSPGGSEAARAGEDLEALLAVRPNEERVEDAFGLDTVRELGELRGIEVGARVVGMLSELVEGYGLQVHR
jgi:hypothetical protein